MLDGTIEIVNSVKLPCRYGSFTSSLGKSIDEEIFLFSSIINEYYFVYIESLLNPALFYIKG